MLEQIVREVEQVVLQTQEVLVLVDRRVGGCHGVSEEKRWVNK